jgi:catechol 2,3-dioxygenase
VADLDRSLRFYCDVFGLQVARRRAATAWLAADGAQPLVVLTEHPGARPKPPRTTGLYHYAVLVPGRTELARVLKHLLERRYPLQGAADHLVSEALYLADPDGNGIEIYADRPREDWPRRDGRLQMATEPLDGEGLLSELNGDSDEWKGMPPQTRVGHIHLHVADLHQARAFYCDALGFELVTGYPPEQAARGTPSALFVSAGGYHHHIGLNIWAGVGAPPPPPDSVGLRFYTIRLPDDRELQRTAQRLRASGIELDDGGDAITLHDPSENMIQLTAQPDP